MSGKSPGRRLTVLYGAVRGFDPEQVLSLHMHGLVQNASPQTWQDQPQFLLVVSRRTEVLTDCATEVRRSQYHGENCDRRELFRDGND